MTDEKWIMGRASRLLAMLAVGFLGSVPAAELKDSLATYQFDDATGRIAAVIPAGSETSVANCENRYVLLAKSGDHLGLESKDKVIRTGTKDGALIYECTNPELPDFTIRKRYWLAEGGLRRELTFFDLGKEIRFIQPSTETHFAPEFMAQSYWFGAGYCGPYLPAPKVKKPTIVNDYAQSSKGMVLCNNDLNRGSFSHYRVKLNDVIVWPWHHSAIGRYREKEDRLYYLPDGWRVCLGTFDPKPGDGKTGFRVTDQFNFFRGDIFAFFTNVWGKDSEFQKELNSIPAGPEWCDDTILLATQEPGALQHWAKTFDEGWIRYSGFHTTIWGDYRPLADGTYPRSRGGRTTLEETLAEVALFRSISPLIKCDKYHITVAAAYNSQVVREHPEWFRRTDRDGNPENLFPGNFADNYQYMADDPACREFIVNNIFDDGVRLGLDAINIDEAQQQNTIDWQKMRLVRDDHIALMWKMIRARSIETGIAVTMNGSGNPYADQNAMEASWQIKPEQWRRMCGIALGLELFTQYRQNPIYLLYWWNRKKGDYINRNLAMGWIPVPQKVRDSSVPAIRAIYECGKTLPLPVIYTPDWKKDFNVEWESYTVRRAKDRTALLSFIQRKKGDKEMHLDLTLDLATLGFAPEERINLYYSALDTYPQFALTDRELKQGYREAHWVTPGVAHPKLVYSGPAKGSFQYQTAPVATGDMVQFVALPAGPALFAVNDLPLNWPLQNTRHVRIAPDGTVAAGEKTATVLLVDRDFEFTDITLDGSPAAIRPGNLGDVSCTFVDVPAGTHKLAWKSEPRKPVAPGKAFTARQGAKGKSIEISGGEPSDVYLVEKDGFTCTSGTAPLALPTYYAKGDYTVRRIGTDQTAPVKLTSGNTTAVRYKKLPPRPEERKDTEISMDVKGLHLSKTLTWISSGNVIYWGILPDMPPAVVSADPETLTLTAGHTRKDDTMDVCEYAGFEFTGAKTLRLAFSNTFWNATSCWGQGTHTYDAGNPQRDFTGIVIDYHTPAGYTKRVTGSVGLFDPRMNVNTAPWGRNAVADLAIDLGDLISKPQTTFTLDLTRFAPKDWDGKVIFAIGNNVVLANRRLTVQIVEVNPKDPQDVLGGTTAEGLVVERKMPPPIGMVKLSGDAGEPRKWQEAQWKKWTRTEKMTYYPESASPQITQQTCGYFSYDERGINFAIEGMETERQKLIVDRTAPWRGDEVELYLVRPDGTPVQICISADAHRLLVMANKQEIADAEVKIYPRIEPGKKFTVLGRIPYTVLGLESGALGTELRFNFLRTRRKNQRALEYTTWAPITAASGKGFLDVEHYGKMTFGCYQPGQGRYEEVTISVK